MTDDGTVTVRPLAPHEAWERVDELSDVLVACVNGGAGVSFMAPLDRATADRFWRDVADGVAANDRVLVVAEIDGRIVGTAQVVFAWAPNQPHRADVAKMLVHPAARKRGIGALLVRAAEDAARVAGRTLLVLDTVTGGDAERLYARLGWTRVGEVPKFALMPDGTPASTTFFYKDLSAER